MTIEQKIHDCINGAVKALGYDIVRIRMLGSAGGAKVLEILIERIDGNHISVGDCSSVSHNISTILDVEDVIDYAYNLEVSSAGVERPLVKLQDFDRFIGYTAQVKLHQAVGNTKKYEGKILSVEEDKVKMDCGQNNYSRCNSRARGNPEKKDIVCAENNVPRPRLRGGDTTRGDGGTSITLDFENIKDAKLVLTEELFRKIIK